MARPRYAFQGLSPGDGRHIYVDTGVYPSGTNIALTAADSGITIQGPVKPGDKAVLDRGNTSPAATSSPSPAPTT